MTLIIIPDSIPLPVEANSQNGTWEIWENWVFLEGLQASFLFSFYHCWSPWFHKFLDPMEHHRCISCGDGDRGSARRVDDSNGRHGCGWHASCGPWGFPSLCFSDFPVTFLPGILACSMLPDQWKLSIIYVLVEYIYIYYYIYVCVCDIFFIHMYIYLYIFINNSRVLGF